MAALHMEPFQQCLALGPVAVYLVLLGAVNLSRRPFLVSGTRDTAALGLAVSGLIFVGPLALFFPETTAAHFGPQGTRYVWLMLLALYALGLVLVLLVLRPRLILYNMSVDQLRPILADLVDRLDPNARWAGDSLVLPALGIQLHLDATAWMRNVSLVSAGGKQSDPGWAKFEAALACALLQIEVPRNPRGVTLMSLGLFLGGVLAWTVARDPQAITLPLFELLQR